MYEYFSTNGKSQRIPADISRKVVEAQLVDAFHWLPQDIAEIPYQKIKDLLMILQIRDEYRTSRHNAEQARDEAKQMASGRGKFYREV